MEKKYGAILDIWWKCIWLLNPDFLNTAVEYFLPYFLSIFKWNSQKSEHDAVFILNCKWAGLLVHVKDKESVFWRNKYLHFSAGSPTVPGPQHGDPLHTRLQHNSKGTESST